VVSVYLQTARGCGAIETGLIVTPATIGIQVSSLAAGCLAQRRPQATLIRAGFITTIRGVALLLRGALLDQRAAVRARLAAGWIGHRRDADVVGQRCAIEPCHLTSARFCNWRSS
jgi:hypothetical protein